MKNYSVYEDPEAARNQLENPADYRRYAAELLDFLPIKSGKLLDIGCGVGWLVKEAKTQGFEAMGVDASKTFVKIGRKELGLDLRNSYPKNQKFDVIVAKHTLEHIVRLEQFLTKIFRLLKPGGYFLVACPNIASLMYFIFGDRWYGLCPDQHVWQFTSKTLTTRLRRNGFKIEKVIINSLDYQPPGVKRLIFKALVGLANFFRIGDQVIIICYRH